MNKKREQYPHKTTLNLVIKERGPWSPIRVIPLLGVVLLGALTFGKFAVADRLYAVEQEREVLTHLEQQINDLELASQNYREVADQYRRYSSNWRSDEERASVACMEVIDLVEREIMDVSTVQQYTLTENVLTVNFSDVSLEEASHIVTHLNTYDMVELVAVHTAISQVPSVEKAELSMVITLTREKEGG